MQGGAVETETVGKDNITGGGKKKVVVIGAGWAGLAAAYELSKQVFGSCFSCYAYFDSESFDRYSGISVL